MQLTPPNKKRLSAAIQNQDTIPQDLLYQVAGGVDAWQDIVTSNETPLGVFYDDFTSENSPPKNHVVSRIVEHFGDNPKGGRIECLLLGIGAGQREASICVDVASQTKQMLVAHGVDLSNSMLEKATAVFSDTPTSLSFTSTSLDFLDQTALETYRESIGANSCCVLAIGNTLGNGELANSLESLSESLEAGDLFVAELVFHEKSKSFDSKETSAKGNWREPLCMNFIRELVGEDASLDRFMMRTTSSSDDGIRCTQFFYVTSLDEREKIASAMEVEPLREAKEIKILESHSYSREFVDRVVAQTFESKVVWEYTYPNGTEWNKIPVLYLSCVVKAMVSKG